MIAYQFYSEPEPESAFAYARMVFFQNDKAVPAVECSDFFASEIQAEAEGLSESNFYTETFKQTPFFTPWVCPNLNQTELSNDSLTALLMTCQAAKGNDPGFLPEQVCKSKEEIEKKILETGYMVKN